MPFSPAHWAAEGPTLPASTSHICLSLRPWPGSVALPTLLSLWKDQDSGENTDLAAAPHRLQPTVPATSPGGVHTTPVPGMTVIGGQGRWEGGGLPAKVPPHMERHLQTARQGLWVLLAPLCHLTLVSCHPGLELHPVPPLGLPPRSCSVEVLEAWGQEGSRWLRLESRGLHRDVREGVKQMGGFGGSWAVPVLDASRGDCLMVAVPGMLFTPSLCQAAHKKGRPHPATWALPQAESPVWQRPQAGTPSLAQS